MRDKKEKFIALAERRVNNALKQIELIGNLSNKANYEYGESDYQKIFKAIDADVRIMKQRFTDATSSSKKKFNF